MVSESDAEELLPIGAFAGLVHLSVSAIRFYDDCGLLKPAYVDAASGYRYFHPRQLDRARMIRDLRAAEMPIAGIRAVLEAPPVAALAMLAEHAEDLEVRLMLAKERLTTVRTHLHRSEIAMPSVTLPAGQLRDAVAQVAPAAAPSGSAPNQQLRVIEGILVAVSGDALRLVATDRYRLAVRDVVPLRVDGGEGQIVVEAPALRAAVSTAVPDTAVITVQVGETLTVGHADVTTDVAPIGEGRFPNYEKLLPQSDGMHRAIIPVTPLLELLEALMDRTAVALHFDVTVAVGPPGTAGAVIEGSEASGGPLTVGVNPHFLAETARLAVGPDVLVEANDPHRPLVVRSATDGSYTCLIMPVTLDGLVESA